MANKLFKRWKKDKRFRNNVIIGAFLFMLFSGMFEGLGTQATVEECNSHNSFVSAFYGIEDNLELNRCEQDGCFIEVYKAPPLWPFSLDALLNTASVCVLDVPVGHYTRDPEGCKYGYNELALQEKLTYCGDLFGQCYVCEPEGKGIDAKDCKSWQKPFAKIIDSFWKKNDLDCSTKAYLMIGAAGLLVMAFI